MKTYKELINTKINLLTIKEVLITDKGKRFLCECECGVIKDIRVNHVINGLIKSCGCLRVKKMKETFTKHGNCSHPLFDIWDAMKYRCENPKSSAYKNYGGRGIKVCERWQDFNNFVQDVSPKPSDTSTLERIDVDGNYCLENFRWATRKEQANNTRTNNKIEYKGETKNIIEWSEIFNIHYMTIYCRLKRGWSIEKSLETQPINRGRHKEKNNG